jgi:hypothetical protein
MVCSPPGSSKRWSLCCHAVRERLREVGLTMTVRTRTRASRSARDQAMLEEFGFTVEDGSGPLLY